MESFGWPESMPSVGRKAIEELVKGRETANKLRSLLVANGGSHFRGDSLPAEQLVTQILSSFANTLSILNTRPVGGGPGDDYSDEVSNFPASRKSEDSGETSKYTDHQLPALQSRRGSYKRRKLCHTWITDTDTLVDDGHGWRKYGQKVILNTKYPRSYFRCTHKYDQGCQATKQVQMLDVEPTVYRTTYAGLHTCTSPLKDSELLLDHTDSSELISFAAAANPHPFFGVKQEQLHAAAASTTSTDDVAAGAHVQSQSSHDNFYLPADDDTFDHVSGDVISSSCTTSVQDSFDCFDHHQMIGDLDEDDLRLIHLSGDGLIN